MARGWWLGSGWFTMLTRAAVTLYEQETAHSRSNPPTIQNGPSLPSSSGNINSDVPNLPSPPPKFKFRGKHRWLAHKWYHQKQLNFMATTTNTPPTHKDADFGNVMGPKANGCVWLGGGNIDTFHTINFNNKKGNLLRAFICENELDGFFVQESGLNWDLMPWSGCLDAILQTENHMKTTAAHNVHHKVNRQQWGGTFAATFGELATQVSEMGKDVMGLGRWSWMLCKGLNGHTTCIITAYNPNQSTRTKTKTIYCQHQSYLPEKGIPTWLWTWTAVVAIHRRKSHCFYWHEWRLTQRKHWCYAWFGWAWNDRGSPLHPPWASSSPHLPMQWPLWMPCSWQMLCHPWPPTTQGSLAGNLQMPWWPLHPNHQFRIQGHAGWARLEDHLPPGMMTILHPPQFPPAIQWILHCSLHMP